MASSFSSPKLIHGFHGPNSCSCIPHFHSIKLGSNRSQTPLSFRFRDAARLQLRTRLYTVFASNSSPSDGDSSEEKSGGTISSDDARGAAFQVDRILYWSISEQKVDFYSTRTQETTYVRSLDMGLMLRHYGLIEEQKRNGCHSTDSRRKTTKQQDDISAQCDNPES
ncbi:hypothetical protein NC653_002507 [Populus alba x Populus x berolinensis]|nr:hypothetical protein NC653_002507 [Populus alba x Populus x berolinensis]